MVGPLADLLSYAEFNTHSHQGVPAKSTSYRMGLRHGRTAPTYSGQVPRVYLSIAAIALFIYAFTDCVQASRTNYLTKSVWLVVITFVPVFGPIAWLLFGRGNGGGWWDSDAPVPDPVTSRDFDRSR